jgi:hypothetical protein
MVQPGKPNSLPTSISYRLTAGQREGETSNGSVKDTVTRHERAKAPVARKGPSSCASVKDS